MDMKNWDLEVETVMGRWVEEDLRVEVNGRVYVSDWTPMSLRGNRLRITHTGRYAKIILGGGQKVSFHRQLCQDYHRRAMPGDRYHVHHKDGKQDGDVWVAREQNNFAENLECEPKDKHLAKHAAEGGPGKRRRRQWSAAKTKPKRTKLG